MTEVRDKVNAAGASILVRVLEGVTIVILALVPAALAWLTLMAYVPLWARLPSVEWEIYGVLLLLAAGVALVSVLALLQTWTKESEAPVHQGPS